jgi:hypothetical protein
MTYNCVNMYYTTGVLNMIKNKHIIPQPDGMPLQLRYNAFQFERTNSANVFST